MAGNSSAATLSAVLVYGASAPVSQFTAIQSASVITATGGATVSTSTVTLTFRPPTTGTSGGAAITAYNVSWQSATAASLTSQPLTFLPAVDPISGLVTANMSASTLPFGTVVAFTVVPVTSVGAGDAATTSVLLVQPPSTPSSAAVVQVASSLGNFSVAVSVAATSQSPVSLLVIGWSTVQQSVSSVTVVPRYTSTYTFPTIQTSAISSFAVTVLSSSAVTSGGRPFGQLYLVSVVAVNAAGSSGSAETVVVVAGAPTRLPAPQVQQVGNSSVTVSLALPSDVTDFGSSFENGGSAITSVSLYWLSVLTVGQQTALQSMLAVASDPTQVNAAILNTAGVHVHQITAGLAPGQPVALTITDPSITGTLVFAATWSNQFSSSATTFSTVTAILASPVSAPNISAPVQLSGSSASVQVAFNSAVNVSVPSFVSTSAMLRTALSISVGSVVTIIRFGPALNGSLFTSEVNPAFPAGALLFSVGSMGALFAASSTPLTSTSSGQLYLAINGASGSNTGLSTVAVSIGEPQCNQQLQLTVHDQTANSNAVLTFSPFATSVVISSLIGGHSYNLSAAVVNLAGVGPSSTQVTFSQASPPSAATVVSVVQQSATTALLTIALPTHTGGAPLLNWTYALGAVTGSVIASPATSTVPSSVVVSGLPTPVTGTGMYLSAVLFVSTVAGSVASSASNVVFFTGYSLPVSALAVAQTAASTVSVSLSTPAMSGSGAALIGSYLLIWYAATDLALQYPIGSAIIGSSVLQTTVKDPSLVGSYGGAGALTFDFYIQAINAAGSSLASSTPGLVNLVSAPPAPVSLVAVQKSATIVQLSFTAATVSAAVQSSLVNFTLTAVVGGTVTSTLTLIPLQSSSPINVTVAAAATVSFNLVSWNVAGPSPVPSTTAPLTIAGIPSVPLQLSAFSYVDSSTVLNFTAPVSNGGSAIQSYLISELHGLVPSFRVVPNTTAQSTFSAPVTGLQNGQQYSFAVLATNVAGNSAAAQFASVTPAAVPSAPTSLSVTEYQDSSTTLSWTAPASSNGAAVTKYVVISVTASLSGYSVTVQASTSCSSAAGATAATQCSALLTGLHDGQPVQFVVQAVNAAGAGPQSAVSPVVLPAAIPSAPQLVSATAYNSAVSTVSFSVPANVAAGTTGVPILSYTVSCIVQTLSSGIVSTACLASTYNASQLTAVSGQMAISIGGLINGKSYVFSVSATNVAGTSVPGMAAAIIPASPPSAPSVTCMRAATSGDSFVSFYNSLLYYSAPASTGGVPVLNYTISALPYFSGQAPSITFTYTSPSNPLILPVAPSCTHWLNSSTGINATNIGNQSLCYSFSVPAYPALTLPSFVSLNTANLLNSGNPIVLSSGVDSGGGCQSDRQFYLLPTAHATWQSTFVDSTGKNQTFAAFSVTGDGQLYYTLTSQSQNVLPAVLGGARVRIGLICAYEQYSFVEFVVNYNNGSLLFPPQMQPTDLALAQQTAYIVTLTANNAAGQSPSASVLYAASPWNVCLP